MIIELFKSVNDEVQTCKRSMVARERARERMRQEGLQDVRSRRGLLFADSRISGSSAGKIGGYGGREGHRSAIDSTMTSVIISHAGFHIDFASHYRSIVQSFQIVYCKDDSPPPCNAVYVV